MKYTNIRYKDDGDVFPITREISPGEGLTDLLVYQISYGAEILEYSPVHVKVQTRVLNCLDVVTYEGTLAEMDVLHDVAMFWGTYQHYPETIEQRKMSGVDMFNTFGKQLFESYTAVQLIAAYLIRDSNSPIKVEISKEDLCAVIDLVRRDKVSVQEAFWLATAEVQYDATGKSKGILN